MYDSECAWIVLYCCYYVFSNRVQLINYLNCRCFSLVASILWSQSNRQASTCRRSITPRKYVSDRDMRAQWRRACLSLCLVAFRRHCDRPIFVCIQTPLPVVVARAPALLIATAACRALSCRSRWRKQASFWWRSRQLDDHRVIPSRCYGVRNL